MNFQNGSAGWHTRARERSARVRRPVLSEIPVFKIKFIRIWSFYPGVSIGEALGSWNPGVPEFLTKGGRHLVADLIPFQGERNA